MNQNVQFEEMQKTIEHQNDEQTKNALISNVINQDHVPKPDWK
jgi:hypothetical protein